MALNIDLVNGGINVYETGETPRTYFGAIGASGKIYPSGSINGVLLGTGVKIISSNLVDIPNDFYENIPQASTTGSGSGATFQININDGAADYVTLQGESNAGLGYSVGDLIIIDGASIYEGGSGTLTIKVTNLVLDGILFVVGGDDYQIQWDNLVINGTSPTSLNDAMSLLSTLLSGLTSTPTFIVDLNPTPYNAPSEGIYYVYQNDNGNKFSLPNPSSFLGKRITVINVTGNAVQLLNTYPAYDATLTELTELHENSTSEWISINNQWIGGFWNNY